MSLADRYLPYYTVEDREKWKGDWELIEGVPFALASPSIEHQRVISRLLQQLQNSFEKCKECEALPDLDYFISEDTVVRPDVIVLCKKVKEKLTIPPDIIFEIVSPSSVKMDEHIKFELYEREGIKFYVLIYPFKDRKHVKVFQLLDSKYKKVIETINDTFEFSLEKCRFVLDFSKIWK